MSDDPRKLRKTLEILNENNVSYYRQGDLEIRIHEKTEKLPDKVERGFSMENYAPSEEAKLEAVGPIIQEYTDEEILHWSANG